MLSSDLPSIASPTLSASSKSNKKESLTLPPINSKYHTLSTAKKPSPSESDPRSFPVPLKKSEITQILEAAKKSRDDKIAATLGVGGRAKRKIKPATFVSPRASFNGNRSKHAIPQQTVVVDTKSGGSTHRGEVTEVIDLENSDTGSVTLNTEVPDRSTPVDRSLQGQNTKSQPHLSNSHLKKAAKSKPARKQRLRRSRSHVRIGSIPFTTSSVGKGESQTMSVSMEDVSSKPEPRPSSAIRREQANVVIETKGMSTSRPIVKKPNFVKQNTKRSSKPQAPSVYAGRPYVIPVARKIIQQTKSPRHPAPRSGSAVKSKRLPVGQYPRLKRKHHPLTKQELSMPTGKWIMYTPGLNDIIINTSPISQGRM